MSIYIYSTEAMDSRQRSYGYVTYVKVTLAWLMDCRKINRDIVKWTGSRNRGA